MYTSLITWFYSGRTETSEFIVNRECVWIEISIDNPEPLLYDYIFKISLGCHAEIYPLSDATRKQLSDEVKERLVCYDVFIEADLNKALDLGF